MNPFQEFEIMRKNSGFTMIEVIIVIALMGIITAIAVPNFLSWIPEKRLRSASDDLFSNLLYTKMQAIKNNVDWAVVFNFSGNSYTVQSDYGGSNTVEKTVNLTSYSSGVRYGAGSAGGSVPGDPGGGSIPADAISYTGPSNVAVFTSRGMADTLGYVYLTNDSNSSVAVGTPVLAGVVVQRVWSGTAWE